MTSEKAREYARLYTVAHGRLEDMREHFATAYDAGASDLRTAARALLEKLDAAFPCDLCQKPATRRFDNRGEARDEWCCDACGDSSGVTAAVPWAGEVEALRGMVERM